MPQVVITDKQFVFPHLLYTPDNLADDSKLPLIVFLHGVGERGTDPTLVMKWSLPRYLHEGNALSAIVVSPQCPEDTKWELIPERILEFIDSIIETQPVDTNRVYLTGFSMGGRGTWAVAIDALDKFAALAPVAGRIPTRDDFLDKVCVLKDKPIWIFHGAMDTAVAVENSDTIVQTLRDCGASNLKYTRYDDADHGQASDRAYSNTELYDWLLQHDTSA
jgi:predicted peptidase